MSQMLRTGLRFRGTLDALAPIRKYVEAVAQSAHLERSAVYRLCLAVDEIATNIVVHGYEEAGLEGDLKVGASVEGDNLVIQLEDHGKPYDPNFHNVPEVKDFSHALESRKMGGLGIYWHLPRAGRSGWKERYYATYCH